MSRSIHHTKSRGIRQKPDPGPDSDIAAQIRKSTIKRLVRIDRKFPRQNLAPVTPDAIKYTEEKLQPYLFFPATLVDVRHVLSDLPSGYLNGVSHIQFLTGKEFINAHESVEGQVLDPILKRKCTEFEPGVFVPIVLGTYHPHSGNIQIFAYALDPSVVLSETSYLVLKIQMLQAGVHELAPNHDSTQRVARGRWRMDNTEKAETYAIERASEFFDSVLIPYFRRIRSLEYQED